ncbi:MAG TPA: hypothetical protein VES95_11160 [Dermatophilaceae bacterium]|nr:hypothetical protein [Dermatophilaceae bacterium]
MSEASNEQERQAAATEAAQNVVDDVTAWNYSGDREIVESALEDGLAAAGVDVSEGEKERIVEEIGELKQDETRGVPDVRTAEPGDAAE